MTTFFRRGAAVRPAIALSLLIALAAPALADRVLTDQLGREVTLPDTISRAVVLQHHSLDTVVQLDAQDQVVGVLQNWERRLGKGFARLAPELADLSTPGDLTEVNLEELLALDPDVVIVTHYAPQDMTDQIADTGIPIVYIGFVDIPESERGKRDPVLSDEKAAYTDGLLGAVTLIGEIFGKQDNAAALNSEIMKNRAIIEARTANLPDDQRTTIYMANPDMNTYGAGKYTGAVMELAGGLNVAREVQGYFKVEMEQVLVWAPEMIVVQDRYPEVMDQIRNDLAWATIPAVETGRIFMTPEYVKPWGHPTPESVALGELWMGKALHPDLFTDIDLDALVQDYYRKFYRTDYIPAE
ncbi:MAG: ABC transporter substrate-binding protein [Paracoccus sp. (in: a-proteobacteria)]